MRVGKGKIFVKGTFRLNICCYYVIQEFIIISFDVISLFDLLTNAKHFTVHYSL